MLSNTRRGCEALDLTDGDEPIVVACSGGADSAAALHLLHRALPHAQLIACYVDHGIRPKASIARDIAAVRSQARASGARVAIERIDPPRAGASKEAVARERRYAALSRFAQSVAAGFVITGHHRDDLIESLLLALARGSGVDGAASMRARRSLRRGVTLLRPFMWASKADLAVYAQRHALKISEDETNADPSFRRNAVRVVVTALEQQMPGARAALSRSAMLLAGDRVLLDRLTRATLRRCRSEDGSISCKALRKLPAALLRRVIRSAVREADANAANFHLAHCLAIAKAVRRGKGGTFHAGKGARVVLSAGKLYVRAFAAPQTHTAGVQPLASVQPIAAAPFDLVLPDAGKIATTRTPLGNIRLRWQNGKPRGHGSANTILLRSEALEPGMTMTLRTPGPGDKCVPSGRRRAISLSRFLAKSGVPRDERRSVTLLCWRGRVAAVLGIRVMEPFAAKTGRMLAIEWRPRPITLV